MTAADDEIIVIVQGQLVGLGPLRRDLSPVYQRWVNDVRVHRTLALPGLPISLEAEMDWLDGALKSRDAIFTIYELATMRPIGNTGLHAIDHADGTAEFGIVIGEPDVWGKGYGTESTRLLLGYGFDVLGLHHIRLEVYANNERAWRAYERAGFRRAGVLRQAKRIGRERFDVILMDVLADQFPHSHLHEMMHPKP
ncbi:MAG: GNAT family N-acetyltransferase [Chloroflexota bacterium]|nr:GNAT family N-acetyltransferase [Chloroflexota bacterium]